MQRYLTTSQKNRERPRLLTKQDGRCLFCKDQFVTTPANDSMQINVEHLDGNVFNNDSMNLALAHKKCNNEKKYNSDYQIIARAQLKENHNSFESLGEGETKPRLNKESSLEVDLNRAYAKLTGEYLRDRLTVQKLPAVNKKDAARSIAYIMYERVGQGSPSSAQRHIEMFTSTAGPYTEADENGETVILKRQ